MKKLDLGLNSINAALSDLSADPQAQTGAFMTAKARQIAPIFTDADLRVPASMLARILRLFLIERGISLVEFRNMHREWCLRNNTAPSAISSSYGNIKNQLDSKTATPDFLTKIFDIMGYDVNGIEFTVTNRNTGELSTIGTKDVELYLNQPEAPMPMKPNIDEKLAK